MAKLNSIKITADLMADLIPSFYHSRVAPLFVGSPGIGKTDFIREGARQLSASLGENVVVRELHLTSMTETDVRGYLIPVTEPAPIIAGVPPLPGATVTRAVFTKPEFWAAVEQSPRGILFLDEFAQASHEVQKAVAPLLLEGRIGEYILPEGWAVMLASNGLDDDSGTNAILSHVLNRVCRVEVSAPDVQVWESWAMANDVPFELIAFAKLRPAQVFDAPRPVNPDEPYCTPRSLVRLGKIAAKYSNNGIRDMVRTLPGRSVIQGMIGTGPAAELSAVIEMAINLPSFDQVIADPYGTMIPEGLDKKYAMMTMVATRTKIETAEASLAYLMRFDANYAMTAIVSLIRRDPRFVQNQTMAGWIIQHKELLQKFNKWITGAVR